MEQSKYVVFNKDMTNIVKGFAIIFMLLLHLYTPDGYDVALDYSSSLYGWHYMFKLCVGMFVFMVGYGYAFSKTKDLRYGFQHIKKLLIPFWVILFVFTFPFCIGEVMHDDWKTLVYNLFGINSKYNWFSWFVYFYIYAMLVMPLISRFIDKKPLRNAIVVLLGSMALAVLFHEIPRIALFLFDVELQPVTSSLLMAALFNCLLITPGMILGYLFAHQGYYERLCIDTISKPMTLLLFVLVLVVVFASRYVVVMNSNQFQLDVFYAPFIIGAIALLFSKFEWKIGRQVFIKLGELSVYMWFFHALFFAVPVRWFYQPAIIVSDNINIVVLWGMTLTFLASWAIKSVVEIILRYVKSRR